MLFLQVFSAVALFAVLANAQTLPGQEPFLIKPGSNSSEHNRISYFDPIWLTLSAANCISAASDNDSYIQLQPHYLDVSSDRINFLGASVTIQGCTFDDNQLWNFSGGTIRIFGNKCLDVTNWVDQDGTKLQMWTCSSGNTNQQWYYTGDKRYI
jgi:hypothetical protein